MRSLLFFENYYNIARNFWQRKKTPAYVQFYVTAKCNLRCQQCNIIYSNPGHPEMDLGQIAKVARNLRDIGTAIVLLTGGEPFARKDLHKIVKLFTMNGIHVRIQTNGYASRERLLECVQNGARDISISLDSLDFANQEYINGEKKDSWHAAIEAVSHVTQIFPKDRSFASFGCVLSPFNIPDILEVLEFAAKISWHVSLVPIHVMRPPDHPQFESRYFAQKFRPDLLFTEAQKKEVAALIPKLKHLRRQGMPLYDSDVYLDDILRFINGEKLEWRSKNHGVCDAPYLYFAVRPTGNLAPCCEYDVAEALPVYHPDFPKMYRDSFVMKKYDDVAERCSGCMYGSYPEITTAIRFMAVSIQRVFLFMRTLSPRKWPLSYDQILKIAQEIRARRGEPRAGS